MPLFVSHRLSVFSSSSTVYYLVLNKFHLLSNKDARMRVDYDCSLELGRWTCTYAGTVCSQSQFGVREFFPGGENKFGGS